MAAPRSQPLDLEQPLYYYLAPTEPLIKVWLRRAAQAIAAFGPHQTMCAPAGPLVLDWASPQKYSSNQSPPRRVQRSFLCVKEPLSRADYEHRKGWLEQRMFHLAQCFAVSTDAFTIMSNHFHLVVYYDPKDSYRRIKGEVVDRWLAAFPPHAIASALESEDEMLSMHSHTTSDARGPFTRSKNACLTVYVHEVFEKTHCLSSQQGRSLYGSFLRRALLLRCAAR
ncbi:MAG: hypothetical protein ACI8Z1_000568 [Candidatus Azotimanducaceae bacterium]|jgi:hypothetical protein